jgi:hypothetical protein
LDGDGGAIDKVEEAWYVEIACQTRENKRKSWKQGRERFSSSDLALGKQINIKGEDGREGEGGKREE